MSALTLAPVSDARICFPGDASATCEDFSVAALRRIIEEQYGSAIANLSTEKLDALGEFAARIHRRRPKLSADGCCELAVELDREGGW